MLNGLGLYKVAVPAAVHKQYLAGDEGGAARGEVHTGVSALRGGNHAAQGVHCGGRLGPLELATQNTQPMFLHYISFFQA